jgi:PAS domain S-box-containing protein
MVRPDRPSLPHSELDLLRLAAIVQGSNDAIVGKTLEGVVQTWNPAAERIFGWTAEEMIGESIFRLVPDELHDEEHEILATIRSGRHVSHYETTRLHRDGRRLRIALSVAPIPAPDGRIVGASSIKRDITAQHELEQRLHQSQKLEALGRLAGGIAHDFNNLLTAIGGFASFALRSLPADAPARADVLGIRDAAHRGARLTHQLLAFSRRQAVVPEVVDLSATIRESSAILRRLLGEDVRLEIRTADGATVLIDRGHFTQVLLNLVVNARDAMPEGGTLTIALETGRGAEGQVTLAVRDTGKGMDDATRAHLFEPFFTTKPAGRGTGLGLATVAGIVEQAGGTIDVDTAPGRGTSFRITFPRAAGAPPAPEPAAPALRPASDHDATILVVEDDLDVLELVVRALGEAGYDVLPARDARAAATAAASGAVDLLLTDIVMPGVDGRTLAAQLRAERPGLRVLYMSGFTGHALVQPRSDEPDFTLLAKPFTPEALLDAVRSALAGRSQRASTSPGSPS